MADFVDQDPSTVTSSTEDGATATTWSEEPVCLGGVIEETDLPWVYKLSEHRDRGALPPGLKIYDDQPVLVYSKYRKRQVQARTIFKDGEGHYYEVGQTLLVPEDYDGKFEIVPPDFSRHVYHTHIADIAKIMPSAFFTRTKLTAIRIVTKQDGGQEYLQRTLRAGSTLKVLSTFAAKWQTSAEKKGLMKKKSQKQEWTTQEIKYLKCVDKDDTELLVPFTNRGKFNALYEKGKHDSRAIFTIQNILNEFPLPVKVRLIFGKSPVVPCIFTGMLVLKSAQLDNSLVCSTVLNRRNVLIELPSSTPCLLFRAASEAEFEDKKTYKDARSLCHKYANSYASLIKLSPKLDTDQQMVLHIPSTRSRGADDNLKTLNMVTNISLTDDEPVDNFLDSDTDSLQSNDQNIIPQGNMIELREINDIYLNTSLTTC